jgi:hypothetical protein
MRFSRSDFCRSQRTDSSIDPRRADSPRSLDRGCRRCSLPIASVKAESAASAHCPHQRSPDGSTHSCQEALRTRSARRTPQADRTHQFQGQCNRHSRLRDGRRSCHSGSEWHVSREENERSAQERMWRGAVRRSTPLRAWDAIGIVFWWAHQDSNLEPKHYECSALTD